MAYSKELIKAAMACKSADEIKALAATADIKLSDETAEGLLKRVSTLGEMDDDALDGVSGGCKQVYCPKCGSSNIVSVGYYVCLDCKYRRF